MKNIAKKHILGIAPYVPGKPIDEVKREYGLEKVIKLASNENPLGPSPKAVEAVKESLSKLNLYPDGYCFDLRKKLAEKFKADFNNFIFGDGTDEILEMLFLAYADKDDEVIFAHPSFVEYMRYSEMMGAKPIVVEVDNEYKHDLDKIKSKITEKTKMIMICNPNNPTGTIVTKKEVEKFIKEVPDNILIVFDEAYFEFAMDYDEYPDSYEYQKQGYKNVISLRTFSKAYGLAGLRVGYAIADKEVIDMLEKVRLPFNVASTAQIGATAAIDDEEHLRNSIKVNEEGKKYICKELKRMGIAYAETYANFIYIDVKRNGKELFLELLKKGVIIRAMPGNFIRVTIGTMEENIEFINKLEESLK